MVKAKERLKIYQKQKILGLKNTETIKFISLYLL